MSRKSTVLEAEPEMKEPSHPQMQDQSWSQTPQSPQYSPAQPGPVPTPQDPTGAPLSAAPSQQAITSLGSLIDPDAVQGTRFTGPIMSGPKTQGVPGIAPLIERAYFTFAAGSFNIPIRFPNSTILLSMYVMIQQSFNGLTPTLNLNADAAGTSHYTTTDLSVAPTLVTTPITGLLGSSWTAYLQLIVTGAATQGKATALILYSVPGKES